MEVSVTLQYGPLDISIEAEGGEEYKKEIEDLIHLVDEHIDVQEVPESSSPIDGNGGESISSGSTVKQKADSPLTPLEEDVGINVEILEEFIHVKEGDDKLPYILVDDVDILGDRLPDRQRTVALVIMYTEYVREGINQFKSSELKTAIDNSNLSTNNIYKIRDGPGKRYFNHNNGVGHSSRTELLGPGRRTAKEEIEQLAEVFEPE